MKITDDKKLIDIQNQFSQHFPYLRIEFYSEPHESKVGSPNNEKLDAQMTVGAVRQVHTTGDLSINGHQKVSTLEANFRDRYGLNVQVLRKSKSIWMMTTATDDWTLTEQNKRGEEAEKTFPA